MSTHTLPDDLAYVFAPEPGSEDDAPRGILILVEDMTAAIPTALLALTRHDVGRLCDRLTNETPPSSSLGPTYPCYRLARG